MPTSDSVLFEEMPEYWHAWPCRIEVAFSLTPYNCVYRELYEEYAADNCEEIAKKVLDTSHRHVFVHYRVRAVGFVPAFAWYAVSPLRRRTRETYEPRTAICDGAPWEYVADDTLFEIWNRPNGNAGSTRTLMLRVGGRDKQEADINWNLCAKPFLRIDRSRRELAKK